MWQWMAAGWAGKRDEGDQDMTPDNPPIKIIAAPAKYIQGPCALSYLGLEASLLGSRVVCISDSAVWELVGEDVFASLKIAGLDPLLVESRTECCRAEIDRISEAVRIHGADIVIGLGGGKVTDLAKGVAFFTSAALIIAPTVASSDAPTSRVCIIYSEDGNLLEVLHLKKNPDLVLVDSTVIANAPVRFLIAGIGDALATKFEAEQCRNNRKPSPLGGLQTHASQVIAEACYLVIRQYGPDAKAAASQGLVTEALEKVIEANIFLSGLGFENNGLAAAHGLTRGFTRIQKGNHVKLHGEIVAFGLLVQFILEKRPLIFIDEMYVFYHRIGLPYCLAHLGLKDSLGEEIFTIARYSCMEGSPIHNMSEPINEKILSQALIEADRIGRSWESLLSA